MVGDSRFDSLTPIQGNTVTKILRKEKASMKYWLYVIATNGDNDKSGYYDGVEYGTLKEAENALKEARIKNPECDIVIDGDD